MVCIGNGIRIFLVDHKGDFFAQSAAVHKNEGGLVLGNARDDRRHNGFPDRFARHWALTPIGCLFGKMNGYLIHFGGCGADCRHRPRYEHRVIGTLFNPVPPDEFSYNIQRLYGSRKTHPLKLTGKKHQTVHGRHQVSSPFFTYQGVDFIKDDRINLPKYRPAAHRAQHEIQALRGGDQNLRGVP